MDPNFDDVNQYAITSSFLVHLMINSEDDASEINSSDQLLPNSPYKERDLQNGQKLRFAAYRAAWNKCLNKIKEVIEELHDPSVKSVVKEIKFSYLNILPGLPYPELPVVSIINPASGSMYLDHVTTQLEILDQIPESTRTIKSFVTHLYPTDFPNIQAGMRSIIAGFVQRNDLVPQVKRKPSTSLANYDIKFLIAWYKVLVESTRRDLDADAFNLVIVLHDFEQFDPSVMEDVFYICSMHVSQIPIVFLLSLSSPSPEYLQITYPRSTLALLRVRNFNVPSGIGILQEILLKVFFNIDFEPDVMMGPAILEYLIDYYTRFNPSTDAILTILQLAHLKHFTSEPLTMLVHTTPWNQVLSRPESFGFLDSLATRLAVPMDCEDWGSQTSSTIVTLVNRARESFYAHARNLRIGFGFMRCIQAFLERQGYNGLQWSADPHKEGGLCEAMVDVLRGKVGGDIKLLGMFTKKLKLNQLHAVLEELLTFFDAPSLSDEQEARTTIALFQSLLSSDTHDDDKSDVIVYSDVANRLSEWTKTFLTKKLLPLEEADLWDIWYTGGSPFPAELINPSIRASLLSGLLRPHDYAEDPFARSTNQYTSKCLWELPDTSILFKRYLDSGKMINVYDWFESFQTILETQRMEILRIRNKKRTRTPSPRKRGSNKMKQQQPPPPSAETEEALERWKVEVNARFIRALHELDYLGFIKHTKRKGKADHVLRTVFDVADHDGFEE